MITDTQKIFAAIGEAAALEQLAEEAAELSHAALKLARIVRRENPTPVTYNNAKAALVEEIGDVRLCLLTLEEKYGLFKTKHNEYEKKNRWFLRLNSPCEMTFYRWMQLQDWDADSYESYLATDMAKSDDFPRTGGYEVVKAYIQSHAPREDNLVNTFESCWITYEQYLLSTFKN